MVKKWFPEGSVGWIWKGGARGRGKENAETEGDGTDMTGQEAWWWGTSGEYFTIARLSEGAGSRSSEASRGGISSKALGGSLGAGLTWKRAVEPNSGFHARNLQGFREQDLADLDQSFRRGDRAEG